MFKKDINKITTTRLLLFSQHQTTVIDALTWELIWKLMKKWAINSSNLINHHFKQTRLNKKEHLITSFDCNIIVTGSLDIFEFSEMSNLQI